jgi:hypothetical protein
MPTQQGRIVLDILSELIDALDLSTVRDRLERKYAIALGNGTGVNQANNLFHDRRTLAPSANENLDVAGVLTSGLGDTLGFTALKAIIIVAAASNTTTLTVSRPASNGVAFLAAASDAFILKPGGLFVLIDPSAAGIPVAAGTGDLINVSNIAGASAEYDVIFIGLAP